MRTYIVLNDNEVVYYSIRKLNKFGESVSVKVVSGYKEIEMKI